MFGKLKEIRKYEDLTQEEVAKMLGVSRATYAGWECGKDIIPLKRLNQFANLFHTSLDYLVGTSPEIEIIEIEKPIDYDVVAENLKAFREEHKMTQEKLASSLNTSQANIHKYETGKSLITTSYALEFSKQYHYSLDKLVGRNKNN